MQASLTFVRAKLPWRRKIIGAAIGSGLAQLLFAYINETMQSTTEHNKMHGTIKSTLYQVGIPYR